MFFLWQMVGVQEAKLNKASTFKISANIISTNISLDIASHVAMFSSNVVVKYMLLALEGSTAKSHDRRMCIKYYNEKGVKN